MLQIGVSVTIYDRIANSVDPDETSHLDLHCLQRHLCGSAYIRGLKYGLKY